MVNGGSSEPKLMPGRSDAIDAGERRIAGDPAIAPASRPSIRRLDGRPISAACGATDDPAPVGAMALFDEALPVKAVSSIRHILKV